MPKKPIIYTKKLNVLITDEQKIFIDDNFKETGVGRFFREIIDILMTNERLASKIYKAIQAKEIKHNLNDAIERKELFELEEERKQKKILIQSAKKMVLQIAEKNNWTIEQIPDGIINFGVGVCRISKQKFMDVLREP